MLTDTVCRVWVPGDARPEAKRQRFNKKRDGTWVPGARTDEPDRKDWKAWVGACWRQQYTDPMTGPLCLSLTFVRQSPASTPKKPTPKNPWPWAWTKKPDTDNLCKPVKDALTRAGAWEDDAQVIVELVQKVQGPNLKPGVLIEVWLANPPDIPGEAFPVL